MKMVRLEKQKLDNFIRELSAEYSVYAAGVVGGKTKFIPVESADEIDLTHPVTDMSPKGVFFPPSEVLFEYDKDPSTSFVLLRLFVLFEATGSKLEVIESDSSKITFGILLSDA